AIKLSGNYTSSTWTFSPDSGTGTIIVDPPAFALTGGSDAIALPDGNNQVMGTNETVTNGDVITGGAGSNTLIVDSGPGLNQYFTLGDGAHSDIGLSNFKNLTLTDVNASAGNEDSITVTFDASFQNNGALTVDGSALHDLSGGNLTIDAHLATQDSFVLIGSNSADKLIGGAHNDTIVGGGGADTLTGAAGNDTFVFKSATDSQPGVGNFDTITDFTHGLDILDLSAIAGATTVQGTVAEANTVGANSISWYVDNAHNQTIVLVNTTATANHVDMEIHLAGSNINLSGSDILHHS